jgi:hypothetical protein
MNIQKYTAKTGYRRAKSVFNSKHSDWVSVKISISSDIGSVQFLKAIPIQVEASKVSRQSAHVGGKVVSHTHRSPLPAGNFS